MDMSIKLNAAYPAGAGQSTATLAQVSPPKGDVEVEPGKTPDRAELEKAVSDIRDFVQSTQRKLDFSIDDSTHRVVVKVINTDNGEVIRQIPSETALKLAQNLSSASNLLFDDKA